MRPRTILLIHSMQAGTALWGAAADRIVEVTVPLPVPQCSLPRFQGKARSRRTQGIPALHLVRHRTKRLHRRGSGDCSLICYQRTTTCRTALCMLYQSISATAAIHAIRYRCGEGTTVQLRIPKGADEKGNSSSPFGARRCATPSLDASIAHASAFPPRRCRRK